MNKIIVITGPESTAKSTLTRELSAHFNASFFTEYARDYLSGKGHSYSYEDIVQIAKKQVEQYEQAKSLSTDLVFIDTWLVITKVWFEWVFKNVPEWLEKAIIDHPVDLYLLCKPDIPWVPDPLREHGGEDREQLFQIYKKELNQRGFHYVEVGGVGESRILNAIDAVKTIR